jgi:N-formylglutamate amidohydrolase
MEVYSINEPKTTEVPILVSSPHSGTAFPKDIEAHFIPEKMTQPDDTDWYIHELYDFVSEMGMTMVHANISRWVIDLNRSAEQQALYHDGRMITSLCPTTDFFGESIYRDRELHPDQDEIDRRLELYYKPYHAYIRRKLEEIKSRFGFAILFDAHSIRKHVPTIHEEPFADFILGTNDGKSASSEIIESVQNIFKGLDFKYNFPFKGGQITRSFGNPSEGIHAIQLEQAKTNYMDDDELKYHEERSVITREILKLMFKNILNVMA